MEPITSNTTTPPKLCLNFSLPSQASEPAGSASPPPPPLRTSASVPFLWEEAPGKPRQWCTGGGEAEEVTSKSLGLPPRLLAAEVKITNMPSPTTVLDGPDIGRSMSFTFSLRSPGRDGQRGIGYFGSSRWGSFRKAKAFSGGSFDISSSLYGGTVDEVGNDAVSCGGGGDLSDDHDHREGKLKVRRRGSFLTLSHRSTKSSSPNLLASIYESFKQAVPWRRRQEKQRKIAS